MTRDCDIYIVTSVPILAKEIFNLDVTFLVKGAITQMQLIRLQTVSLYKKN